MVKTITTHPFATRQEPSGRAFVRFALLVEQLTKLLTVSTTITMFEGDPAKEARNIIKQRLDFRTASRVFLDPFLIEFEDDRAQAETRWNVIGVVDGRVLFVTYTERNDRIRIISARGAEPNERRRYEDLL